MFRNAPYRSLWAAAILAINICSFTFVYGQVLAAPRLITTALNNGDRVALGGSTRRDLRQATDLGVANPSLSARHIVMVLNRTADRQAALDQYLSDLQNSQSAAYHHWLTPAEFGSRFGASADDVQAIAAWLQSQGLTIEKTSVAANIITFSGTVGQIQDAFSTTIHRITFRGEKHLANLSAPQVPRALAPAVKGLVGLDDFHPKSNAQLGPSAKFNPSSHRIEPDLTLYDSAGNPYLYVDPADAATIYDVPNTALNADYKGASYDGTGVTVGIVGDSNVDLAPVTNYRLAFLGETTATVNLPTVIVDGYDPGINGDEIETFLDLEVLGGMAPKAKINYYTSDDSDISAGLFNAMQRAINDNQISILSISFGGCETSLGTAANQFFNELYEQGSAQGITITVSSGDSGAAGCDSTALPLATAGLAVNGLGSTPYNISVGGTDYDALPGDFSKYVQTGTSGTSPYYETALGYIPERPWNDSTYSNTILANNINRTGVTNVIGAGGGKSGIYAKPAFQSSLTPADAARDLPDVSFLAGNGFYGAVWVLCQADPIYGADCATTNGQFTAGTHFSGVGGTSAATPAFAGMLALVVQATGSRLGQANNVLYKLAASKYSTVFHDVTTGNNSVSCATNSTDCGANGFTTGYDAGAGYDLASGLGSVDAAAMLANWSSAAGTSSQTTLKIDGSTSPVSVAHGTSLQFAVNVNPSAASGLAGLVTTAPAAVGVPTLNGQQYTIPITNGTGTGSYNGLPGGQYTVYANYGGDLNDAASQSNAISVNIAPEPSSTLLSVNAYTPDETSIASLSSLPYGSFIFGEASVYGTAEGFTDSLGYATGIVTYIDNGVAIGTAPIASSNLASFPQIAQEAFPFAPGTHKLTAAYPGDASYKANTSNEIDFSVVKGSTSVSLTPANPTVTSTTSDNVEVDVLTTSLGTPPTGTLTVTANGTTLASTSALAQAYKFGSNLAFSYIVIPVKGSLLANGTNTITATYTGDGNYTASSGATAITSSESTFSLKTSSITVEAGSTTGNTATITVTPSGSFAGLVNLTCTVTMTPANATSPVTCSVPSSILVTGTGIVAGTLTVNSTATTTAGAYVVTVTGKDAATGTLTSSATSNLVVTGIPGVVLSSSGQIAVAPGAMTGNTSTLTVTPANGFTGVVNLSCAVTTGPEGAVDPITCGVAPASITTGGAATATSVLTINSTAASRSESSMAALHTPSDLLRRIGGASLALGLLLFVPKRRRHQLRLLAVMAAVVALGAFIGCSGGSSGSGGGTTTPTQPGTTSGAYVVTITANPAGAAAQTTIVNVTVK